MLFKVGYHQSSLAFSKSKSPFGFEAAYFEVEGAVPNPSGSFYLQNKAFKKPPLKLLALTKVCSVVVNIRNVVSWHLCVGERERDKVDICLLGKKKEC